MVFGSCFICITNDLPKNIGKTDTFAQYGRTPAHNRVLPRPDPTALPNEPDLISLEARIRVAATRMPVAGTAKALSVARARCEGRPDKPLSFYSPSTSNARTGDLKQLIGHSGTVLMGGETCCKCWRAWPWRVVMGQTGILFPPQPRTLQAKAAR